MQTLRFFALASVLALLGQGCAGGTKQPITPPASRPVPSAAVPTTVGETERIIEYVSGGFSPNEVTVAPGTTVKFVNRTETPVWPASDPHPVHTALPGFDALRGLGKNESYSFKFNTAGEWKFHNHLSPGMTGKVIVR